MSILDKHPAPWRHDADTLQIEDAHEIVVACDVTRDAAPLILSAPELLAALKDCVDVFTGRSQHAITVCARTAALISRIEENT